MIDPRALEILKKMSEGMARVMAIAERDANGLGPIPQGIRFTARG
jgi:hypothetical protein